MNYKTLTSPSNNCIIHTTQNYLFKIFMGWPRFCHSTCWVVGFIPDLFPKVYVKEPIPEKIEPKKSNAFEFAMLALDILKQQRREESELTENVKEV